MVCAIEGREKAKFRDVGKELGVGAARWVIGVGWT